MVVLRIVVSLHSAEPRVPTEHVPKELKQSEMPKSDVREMMAGSDICLRANVTHTYM